MTVETATKSRPILFSGPMVKAILSGEKTQTRRVVKEATTDSDVTKCSSGRFSSYSPTTGMRRNEFYCPHGSVGDRLWVRENLAITFRNEPMPPSRR